MPIVLPNWPLPPIKETRLLADLFDPNRYIGYVRRVVHLHIDVFFANRLEITGARESREARFERAVIHRLALAQWNSAAQVAVAKPVQSLEFNALDDVRWSIAQTNRSVGGVLVSVEGRSRLDGAKGNGVVLRILRLYSCQP